MKEFSPVNFDPTQYGKGLAALRQLLAAEKELTERQDIQPLFKKSPHLAAFLGVLIPNLFPANRLAYEFGVFGDYTADLVIGNAERRVFCAIELEDARPGSVLRKTRGRARKEWGQRLEHGFGQLVDWFFTFDDHKNSAAFTQLFGSGHIEFCGMLLVGRSSDLTEHDHRRWRWRSDRVAINTHKVFCYTYDELADALTTHWQSLESVRENPRGGKR